MKGQTALGLDVGLPEPTRFLMGAHHRTAGDTELAAATKVAPKAGTLRRQVLDAIAAAGDHGLTDWQIHEHLGCRLYSAAPRRGELVRDGWVIDSGRRRETDSTSTAIVWILSPEGRQQWSAA